MESSTVKYRRRLRTRQNSQAVTLPVPRSNAQNQLPRVLLQFIEEHHGTTVVRYFHHVASEKKVAQGKHDREVSEAEFRYSGPKPRTKESAVLMLCDGVEGAVRSLHEPTVFAGASFQ